MNPLLRFTRTSDRALTPTRNNPTDAGLDLYADQEVVIHPGEILKVNTGIHVALEDGETILFWAKSGRSWDVKNDRAVGLTVLGGCIDGPYRGELIVILQNSNVGPLLHQLTEGYDDESFCIQYCTNIIVIPYGKACVQMIHLNREAIKFSTPKELSSEEFADLPETLRGSKGFGSSDEEPS